MRSVSILLLKYYFSLNLFSAEEVDHLEQLKLSDVIMAVTRMDVGDLQENPFLVPTPGIYIYLFNHVQQIN